MQKHSSAGLDPRETRLCHALDRNGTERVRPKELKRAITSKGIRIDDSRLKESMNRLAAYGDSDDLTYDQLRPILRPNIVLLERILQGALVIPDFDDFSRSLKEIFEVVSENEEGTIPIYIPQLAGVDPKKWGMALCTVDGQRFELGDSQDWFSIQSICKPINYCLALEENGEEEVHKYIGREPSGRKFNEVFFTPEGRPHNPLINAGAIMCASLIKPRMSQGARINHVLAEWKRLAGGAMPTMDMSVAVSEEETGFRNFALANLMMANSAFPPHVTTPADLTQILQFYFRCCSIQIGAEMMAMVGATLANGGVCPGSGEPVLSPRTVRNCLSIMYSCGMYDFSGEFAFTIGLPAKSGVGGALLVIVPNVLGLCTWSPRLDGIGNSVRGVDFCRRMLQAFNFHNYDNLTGLSEKRDPRVSKVRAEAEETVALIWAASKGDVGAIQRMVLRDSTRKEKLERPDYDGRTPAHLAAAEGQVEVVRYFIENNVELNAEDRWGGSPLDDAYAQDNKEVIQLLESNGAKRGENRAALEAVPMSPSQFEAIDGIDEPIWAASRGNLDALERLVARGQRLDIADYDLRTPLHLAASEGRAEVVSYLLNHGHPIAPRDRWANTPLDDAIRHNHEDVVKLLQNAVASQEKTRREQSPGAGPNELTRGVR
jgi:glutaminase